MLERLLAVVVPVVLVVAVGWWLAGRRKPDLADVNRWNVDLFCPALIVLSLSAKDFHLAGAWPLALASTAVVLGSGLIAWGVARALAIEPRQFVPSMMFNNCGNMGLPLAWFAFGDEGLRIMVVLFAVSNLLMFTLGTRFVRGRFEWRAALLNPMVIATAAGLAMGLLEWRLPAWLQPAVKMLADLSIPLMLISLGVRMRDLKLDDWRLPVLGAVVCPLSGLAMLPLVEWLLPLSGMQQGVLMLFAALPPAVLNYLLAERYQQSPQRVASIVLFGNLASLLVIPLVVAGALQR